MTDWDMFAAMQAVFDEINRGVGDVSDTMEYTAAELLPYFAEEGGNLTVVGQDSDFCVRHEPVEDVYDWDDPWPVTYGLDGSTTTPLSFHNGLLLGAAAAKIGVAGDSDRTHLADDTTVTAVVYLNDDSFSPQDVRIDVDGVNAHLFRFPPISRDHSIDEWIVDIARGYAEGSHARTMAQEVDGPLFLDGPIYPNPLFDWMLFEQVPGSPMTPAEVWPEIVSDVLQSYIHTVETMDKKRLPMAGIIKTSYGSRAIAALERKIPADAAIDTPLPWSYDHQLFSAALHTRADKYGEEGTIISYTPWLLQTAQEMHDETIVPFETYDDVTLDYGTADDYQRAFFYVRTPLTDNVMRVEAPYMMIERKRDRERLQRKALVELAQQQKEPRAITLADERTRITQRMRNDLRSIITATQPSVDYNERRGYREFDAH